MISSIYLCFLACQFNHFLRQLLELPGSFLVHRKKLPGSASKTGRKHIPTRLFKQAVNLSKQARAIEATLDGITPFNAGKKKEEALSMLKKWFPQMENFSGQLKKYKVTISDLLAENEKLEARARASENGKMKDRMERAKLESELQNIQKLVDRIPPEVLAELKRQQRHTKER